MERQIPFLKGHMGGNEIVLAPRRDFPRSSELEMALKVLERPHVGGDQLGLLYKGTDKSDLRTKIVDINSRDYLEMCGGLTQVLGFAHWQLDLREIFGFNLPSPAEGLDLETDMGLFSLEIGSGGETTTIMDTFLVSVYDERVEAGIVNGVESFRVGDFFVTFEEEIRKEHPDVSFSPLDKTTKDTLIELQREFRKEFATGKDNSDFAILGESKEGSSDGRLIFPHKLSEGLLEPACGTGTIAVALALAERGSIPNEGEFDLHFESGGTGDSIGGPDVTSVKVKTEGKRLMSASFSHSFVELLAVGKLFV